MPENQNNKFYKRELIVNFFLILRAHLKSLVFFMSPALNKLTFLKIKGRYRYLDVNLQNMFPNVPKESQGIKLYHF
jgi:hypothetical protein